MIKLIYHTPGTSPASLQIEGRTETKAPTISLWQYDDASLKETVCSNADEAIRLLDPEKINWINVDGLGDSDTVRLLAAHFGLSPLFIEDILTSQRPKMESFDDGIFIITSMIYNHAKSLDQVEIEQLSLCFGMKNLITFQAEQNKDPFDEVRRRLRITGSPIRKAGTDYLAYALLDAVVDHYFPVLEMIGDETELLEEKLVEHPCRDFLKELFYHKRLLLEMRRGAWPQREVFSHLMHEDRGFVQEHTRAYLRDCYDHITQIIDIVESYRDLTSGLMDVYHSSLSFRTNEIMRVLTLVSTFFMPLTFLAGVYGMNFHDSPYNMPELGWRYGYIAFWCFSLLLTLSMLVFFRRKKWL